jgi:predicted negative regulator of RcsB-dependent stress response
VARTEHIRRKDLRRPDEFVTLSRRAIAWTEENRTAMYIAIGALVVLLAAILVYRAMQASQESSAARAYREAHALLDDKKYPDAATAFNQVAESYGSTNYALLARLQSANANLLAGQADAAATGYQRFLDAGPPTTDLRQLALTRLGNAKEQAEKVEEAERAYASAAEISGPFSEEALIGAARTAEQHGDTAKAGERYEQFLAQHPASDQRRLVSARLVALGRTPKADGEGEDTPPTALE